MSGSSPGALEVRRRFAGGAGDVREARRLLAAVLVESGVADVAVHDLGLLVLSELATNAVEHAHGAFEVVLAVAPGQLRIAVADGSPEVPHQRSPDEEAVGGRGLHLVEAVADRWGVSPEGDGKVVWCELALAGGGGAAGRRTRPSAP